jgi:type IV secretory pathway VirB10-like protein
MQQRNDVKPPAPPSSPSVATPVGAPGLRGRVTGVTRIGSKAGLIAMGCLAVLVLAIVYGVSSSGNHPTATAAIPKPEVLPTTAISFDNIPGAVPSAQPSTQPRRSQPAANQQRPQRTAEVSPTAPVLPQAPPVLPQTAPQNGLQGAPAVPDIQSLPQNVAVRMPAPIPTVNPAVALRQERERQAQQLAEAARHSGIIIRNDAQTATVPATTTAAAAPNPAAPAAVAAADAAPAAAAANAATDQSYDPNVSAQKAKTEFLSEQKSTTANDYIAAQRQAPISPYEVQAGSVIPATLITGINSDLPGTMIAQVNQNVFDSKTGAYVLIPAGSKIIGKYDSQVTNGQSRVLVAWQRIIFPDSSSINIGGLAGADTAGYSGLTGKVDDHSGKLFRNAILFSLIGAGAALLQPRTIATVATGGVAGAVMAPSVPATIAGQVGSQVSQVAQQSSRQGQQQQPTIEVRPGYLFNVIVDRDLVLPAPYSK